MGDYDNCVQHGCDGRCGTHREMMLIQLAENEKLRAEIKWLTQANIDHVAARVELREQIETLQYEVAAIPEIKAERDALAERWKQFEEYDCDEIKVAYALADELRKERDALKADAERYWWLRDNSNAVYLKEGPDSHGWLPSDSEEIDAAIDAARSK